MCSGGSLTVALLPKQGLRVQDERQEVVGLDADRESCMTRLELRPAGHSFFCPDVDDSLILLCVTVSPFSTIKVSFGIVLQLRLCIVPFSLCSCAVLINRSGKKNKIDTFSFPVKRHAV